MQETIMNMEIVKHLIDEKQNSTYNNELIDIYVSNVVFVITMTCETCCQQALNKAALSELAT